MTVHQIKITRPDEDNMAYFWKLYNSASRNDNRWGGWNVQDIAEELKSTDLDRKQKLFLLRAWQVLVDDQGGFGRLMSAYDTYVLNMQDPEQDVVAWKPEIIRMSEDADLLPVFMEAYEEALLETRRPLPIGELIQRLEEQTGQKWAQATHHNGMMQLSNELADAKAALRRLSAFVRSQAGDIQYTGDHPIAVAEKIAGRDDFFAFGNRIDNQSDHATPLSIVDTAQAQFESLAGEPVSQRYTLREAVEIIRNSGIAIDAEKILAERDALNSPEIPEGSVIVPRVTLQWWRQLLDLNPSDLAPRIDAYIAAIYPEVKS